MAGSIDPRCETLRGTHWPVTVAGVFGTRVAETILASGLPTASTGRTYGCKRSDQTVKNFLWHGGRPHMGPGVRLAFAGTTTLESYQYRSIQREVGRNSAVRRRIGRLTIDRGVLVLAREVRIA